MSKYKLHLSASCEGSSESLDAVARGDTLPDLFARARALLDEMEADTRIVTPPPGFPGWRELNLAEKP